uniref:Uncharacterized protein n=1 Tax=Anguilla anguilla TaxID=7936 RepID=A0A0E9RW77_ANGAN
MKDSDRLNQNAKGYIC